MAPLCFWQCPRTYRRRITHLPSEPNLDSLASSELRSSLPHLSQPSSFMHASATITSRPIISASYLLTTTYRFFVDTYTICTYFDNRPHHSYDTTETQSTLTRPIRYNITDSPPTSCTTLDSAKRLCLSAASTDITYETHYTDRIAYTVDILYHMVRHNGE